MTNEKETNSYVVDASSEFVSVATDENGNTVYVVDRAAQATAEAERAERERQYANAAMLETFADIGGLGDILEKYVEKPVTVDELYKGCHRTVCEENSIPITADYPADRSPYLPAWYRIAFKIINLPIWRLAFVICAIVWGVFNLHPDMTFGSLEVFVFWTPVVFWIIMHTIFGFVTAPIRIVLSKIANTIIWEQYAINEKIAFKAAIANGTVTGADIPAKISEIAKVD